MAELVGVPFGIVDHDRLVELHPLLDPSGVLASLNASMIRNAGTEREERWPSKVTAARLEASDTLQITVPNSAGYGDPLERDPEAVLSDVLDGFSTIELAARDYGVVIDAATMELDRNATRRRREERTVVPA